MQILFVLFALMVVPPAEAVQLNLGIPLPQGQLVADPGWVQINEAGTLVAAAIELNRTGVWSIPEGKLLFTLVGEHPLFSSDGSVIVTSEKIKLNHHFDTGNGKEIYIYFAKDGHEIRRIRPEGAERVEAAMILKKGLILVNSETDRVVDLASGKELATIDLALPYWAQESPDGNYLATQGMGISVFHLGRKIERVLDVGRVKNGMQKYSFSADSRLLVVTDIDGSNNAEGKTDTNRLYELPKSKLRCSFETPSWGNALYIGQMLFVGSLNAISIWNEHCQEEKSFSTQYWDLSGMRFGTYDARTSRLFAVTESGYRFGVSMHRYDFIKGTMEHVERTVYDGREYSYAKVSFAKQSPIMAIWANEYSSTSTDSMLYVTNY